jgi:hypothetical protein
MELPYEFDLLMDIKDTDILYKVLLNTDGFKASSFHTTETELVSLMERHNIPFPTGFVPSPTPVKEAPKHYYTDDGILNYTIKNRDLLVDIAKAFNMDGTPISNAELGELVRMAMELIYDYDIHLSMGESNLGGCLSVEEWKKVIPDCPKQASLKVLLYDYVESGGMYNYFNLVAIDAWSEIKFSLTIG